ncbi:MAG: glycoside hydrolase family 65 protein, partial [Chloroflexi bacterium]
MDDTAWTILETEFDPGRLHHKETVFTLGNGYLGTRGAFEEGYPGAWPATFVHGLYDDVPIVYTELVNAPNWLPLILFIAGERFRMDRGQILRYERRLDLRRGLLRREVRWHSPAGHTVDLTFERFVSLADEHVLALRCQIRPLDFEGPIEVQAGLDGYVHNQGVMHWEWLDQGEDVGGVWLHTRTRHSAIELGMAGRMHVEGAEHPPVQVQRCHNRPTLTTTFQVQPGRTITVEKLVTLFTSRETETPVQAAREKLAELPGYRPLREAHEDAWAQVWQASDVVIEGDPTAQRAVRYNLFQLLAAASRHDDRVS